MNSTKRALRYKFKNTGKSIMMFWITILLLDMLSIFFNIRYGNENTFYLGFTSNMGEDIGYSLFGVNMLPILIYLIIISYTNYYEDFSRMSNFSITRRTIFKANLFSNVSIVFIFSLMQSVLYRFDLFVMEKIGKNPLYEFGLFNIKYDSFIFIFAILFITFFTFVSLWQLIASLNYKFGMKIWAVFLAIVLIGNNIIVNSFSIFDFIFPGQWLNMRIDGSRLFIYLLFITISHVAIYFINKSTNVKT